MTQWWEVFLHPKLVFFCTFPAGAMPDVHAELKHIKSRFEHFLPEQDIISPVLGSFSREVKHNDQPHDAVSIETVSRIGHISKIQGKESF